MEDFDEDDSPNFDLNEPEDSSHGDISDNEPKLEMGDEPDAIQPPTDPYVDTSPREPLEQPQAYGSDEEQEPEPEPEPHEADAAEAPAGTLTPEVSEEERRFREEFASLVGDSETCAKQQTQKNIEHLYI